MQRNFLWKQPLLGEDPFILGLVNRIKPQVKIRQRILNLAYQTFLESKQSLFVVGSLELESHHEGLVVEINSVKGKPQPGVQADFLAQCRFCRMVEARDPNDTVLDLVDDVKTKQYSSREFSAKSLTDYFSLDIHGKLEGPNCSLDLSMVCFERRLKAQKIKEIPLANNNIYTLIQQNPTGLLWGWIHLSKGSLHLLVKDDLRQDCTGVWVTGCTSVHNPLVWLVCQHFLNSVDRSDIFALVRFDQENFAHFYNVTPHDDIMRTMVYSGLEKTTVTRVFTARDRVVDVPLTLCYVDDGEFTMDSTKGNTLVDEVNKEVEQESYRLKTRSGIPQLLSPRPPNQYTPATIGFHKLVPKRITLSPISPPSSSSTPIEKVTQERRSQPSETSSSTENTVPPEVMQLLKKQEMEISFLKEQLKMLMSKQFECRLSAACQPDETPPRIVNVDTSPQNMFRRPAELLSPLKSPEINFAPLRPYVPETMIEERSSSVNTFEGNQQAYEAGVNYYSEVKRGILRTLSDNQREVSENYEKGSFALTRLGEASQQNAHNPSKANFGTNCSILQPRLQYQSLVLSGSTQPSVVINDVTRKYFGKSPQMPTSNKVIGKTSSQVGMLRRVLQAEASKQVFLGQSPDDIQRSTKSTDSENQRFLDVDSLKKQPKLL